MRAPSLVCHHAVDAAAQSAADDDTRDPGDGRGDLGAGHARRHEDQAVGAVFEQRLEHRPLALLATSPGDDQQAIAEVRGEVLDPVGDLGEERVVQVVEEHADGVGPVAGEAAGVGVGAIAETPGGVQHQLTPLRAHLVALAHDERHQRPRDAGLARDVVHRDVRRAPRPRGRDHAVHVCAGHVHILPLERSNA